MSANGNIPGNNSVGAAPFIFCMPFNICFFLYKVYTNLKSAGDITITADLP
jgi:hypothetical protein